jgi:hypothetical protein
MPPCDHSATAALGGAEDAEREPEEAVAEEQNARSRSKGLVATPSVYQRISSPPKVQDPHETCQMADVLPDTVVAHFGLKPGKFIGLRTRYRSPLRLA